MPRPAPEKICGICGEDCSNKPRTKDKSGKYFCKKCYDHAIARKRAGAKPVAHAAVAAPPQDEFGMLDELLGEQNDAAATAPSKQTCSNCGAPMAGGAVICVACGFNTQSGKALNVSAKRAPREPMLGGWMWPITAAGILGIIAICGAIAARGSEAAFGMFSLATILLCATWYVWILIDARAVEGAQAKIYVIPLYFLLYIYRESNSRYLRAMTPIVLASFVAFLVIGYQVFERAGTSP